MTFARLLASLTMFIHFCTIAAALSVQSTLSSLRHVFLAFDHELDLLRDLR